MNKKTITLFDNQGNLKDRTFNLKNVLDISELYHISKDRVNTLKLHLEINQQCSSSHEESVKHYDKITPYINKWIKIRNKMKQLLSKTPEQV